MNSNERSEEIVAVLRQALEALENTLGFTGSRQIDSATRQAITSLRQDIAVAEQHNAASKLPEEEKQSTKCVTSVSEVEPVALMVVNGEISYKSTDDDQSFGMWCPVNYDSSHSFPDGTKFYTHPQPKREWVGLTVMEAVELDIATNHPREFAAAIEAKLKFKNGF